jgi:hypothetical protein
LGGGAGVRAEESVKEVLRGLLIACRDRMVGEAHPVIDECVEDAIQIGWDDLLQCASEYAGVEWHWGDCVVLPHAAFAEWIAVLIGVMEHGTDDRGDISVCKWAIHHGPFGC